MTKEEFRHQLQEILFRQYTTKDEKELALINQEINDLRKQFKLSLLEEVRTGKTKI